MFRLALILLLVSPNAFSQHVILVSVDGFRPEMYTDTSWHTPNLRALAENGNAAGYLQSVFPSYTYPSHTAMITGALPARSKIIHNVKNAKGEWYWFTRDVQVPTLWQALKQKNMTSATVQWPGGIGEEINWTIPEIWDPQHPGNRLTQTRQYATPGLWEEMEQHVTGPLDTIRMNEENPVMDILTADMAAYIFRTKKPNLLVVHFAFTDEMQHAYGTEHDSVRLAVSNADSAIGILRKAVANSPLRDSTTIIIVGDHGFTTIHTVLRPNMLLKDWPVKFTSSGGSAFLYGKAPWTDSVTTALRQLPDSLQKLFRIIDRKELDRMGADSNALLALSAIPGIVFSASVPKGVGPGTNIVQTDLGSFKGPTRGGHHGYDPNIKEMHTGFIAAGRGIKKGTIHSLSEPDIAPLIANLLDIPFTAPDGKLPDSLVQNAGFRLDYSLLHSKNFTADKIFYIITAVEHDREVKQVLQKGLNDFLNAKRQNASLEKIKFSSVDSLQLMDRMNNLYQNNRPLLDQLIDNQLRPSGYYERYKGLDNAALWAKAWTLLMMHTNKIIDQYGLGIKLRYPAIDSADVKTEAYKTKIQTALKNIKNTSLFSRMDFCLQLLAMNKRDEPARFEPLEKGENKKAVAAAKNTNWNAYAYTAILVPGEGPEEAGVALAPDGKTRCDLAAERYRKDLAPFIILSGGFVHPFQTPFCEAFEMKKYLLSLGIPAKAILIEPQARHTTTNFRNASRLMIRYGFPVDKPAVCITTKDQADYIDDPGFDRRNLRELGYLPYKDKKRLDLNAVLFFPVMESLTADGLDPLDP